MGKNKELPNEEITKNEKKDSLVVSVKDSSRVKSLEDLVKSCDVDLTTWEVDWFDVGTYEVTGFDKKRRPVTVTMYRTKAKFKKISLLKKHKEFFQSEFLNNKVRGTLKVATVKAPGFGAKRMEQLQFLNL